MAVRLERVDPAVLLLATDLVDRIRQPYKFLVLPLHRALCYHLSLSWGRTKTSSTGFHASRIVWSTMTLWTGDTNVS